MSCTIHWELYNFGNLLLICMWRLLLSLMILIFSIFFWNCYHTFSTFLFLFSLSCFSPHLPLKSVLVYFRCLSFRIHLGVALFCSVTVLAPYQMSLYTFYLFWLWKYFYHILINILLIILWCRKIQKTIKFVFLF